MNLHSNSEGKAASSHVMLHPVETAVEKLWHVPKLPIVSNSIFFTLTLISCNTMRPPRSFWYFISYKLSDSAD